jgi:hypothetical protein
LLLLLVLLVLALLLLLVRVVASMQAIVGTGAMQVEMWLV